MDAEARDDGLADLTFIEREGSLGKLLGHDAVSREESQVACRRAAGPGGVFLYSLLEGELSLFYVVADLPGPGDAHFGGIAGRSGRSRMWLARISVPSKSRRWLLKKASNPSVRCRSR